MKQGISHTVRSLLGRSEKAVAGDGGSLVAGTSSGIGWKPSEDFLNRLIPAYQSWSVNDRQDKGLLWSGISEKRNDLHDAFINSDRALLRRLLESPHKTNLYLGVDPLAAARLSTQDASSLAAIAAEHIYNLGVAFSVAKFRNPELGASNPDFCPEKIIFGIDSRIDFPNPFSGERGLVTKLGIASFRAVNAIYQARRMLHLVGKNDSNFLEIGAGMGRTAYYAVRFGASRYTIIDLPMALIGQACFLAATLGEDVVALDGEEGRTSAKIRLRPPDWIQRSGESFDLALNADSMTEMSIEYARSYVDFLRATASVFVSINHEANPFTVRSLFTAAEQKARYPYIIRPGYAEEIYEPSRAQ